MASLSTFFINDKNDLKSKGSCVFLGQNYRITILTERLIRLEYNEKGIFEDRATQLVVFRNFEKPLFNVSETETMLGIKTKYFNLDYVKNKPFAGSKITPGDTLKVSLNNSNKVWYYNHPEVRNFGGSNMSLDDFSGTLKLNNGLYSTDGFVTIDDSSTKILNDDDNFIDRENKGIDIYLFMYRKDFGLCLKDYLTLTGSPTMIPRFALGNWWYKNEKYNEKGIHDIVTKFEENKIPLSVMLLGKRWHDDINNYEFDNSLFPNKEGMINYLHNKNIKLGVTLNPEQGISPNDSKYNEVISALGIEQNKRISLLPFDQKKLGIYFKLFVRPLEEKGVDFFNIDYNNSKDLNNLWLLDHYHLADNSKTEAKRGLVLSRNSMIAPHRYPILFSGKTKATWDTLNVLPFYNSSSSNIGVSWWAHAVGGYHEGIEDAELYLRHVQFATFSPIFLLASDEGKYYKREPWKWNVKDLNIIISYMHLRHRLIPYIYAEGYIYHKTGSPLIQPLYYSYPEIFDEPLYRNEYHFGSQMLVVPITKKKDVVMNRVVQRMFIPTGMWYDFVTGKKFPGGNYYVSFFKDEDYPVFCRAGGIIPLSNSDSTMLPKDMEIHIFPGQSNTYKMYEDDGVTNLFKEGYYLLTSIDYNYRANNYTVIIRALEGKTGIAPETRNYKIRFRNTKQADDVIVYVNDKEVSVNTYIDKNDFIIEVNDVPTIGQLTINCKGKDIEIDAVRLINEEIEGILSDLEIETVLKEKIDKVIFSDLSIKKKRIEIRKLKKAGLEPKFIKMFIKLLEYINQI